MDTPDDPRVLYQRALDQLERLFSVVTPELLTAPTPCSRYDLRALLSHTVGGVHRIAYVGEGGRAEEVPSWAEAIGDAEWADAFMLARARFTTAWADGAVLDRIAVVPWDELSGRAALAGYVVEATAHSWDIAQAVAPGIPLDERLAHACLPLARRFAPGERRGGRVPFAAVQPVPPGADAYTRLAAWLGRQV
ncbi:TIGR03086 family metal-binding protein [Saccharothrix sp. ST-888]|uniref:TIGR03086 family metal-binding protein n=1 Tax=Saccharothrix sp. ST-888 TaxID=1427391 RepID=UPI0005ECA5B9|nr:TIGR03086 family metal-binding protein [Saccharothrix sp. ST-888]KJK56936.1 hypothetical protein UK12_19455 [Saccharothrix sp. ST-888]